VRAVRSARIAAEQAGLGDRCEILWPGETPLESQAVAVPAETPTGAAAHGAMLRVAERLGASLYLSADSLGFFAPDCIVALLRMSAAAGDSALVHPG